MRLPCLARLKAHARMPHWSNVQGPGIPTLLIHLLYLIRFAQQQERFENTHVQEQQNPEEAIGSPEDVFERSIDVIPYQNNVNHGQNEDERPQDTMRNTPKGVAQVQGLPPQREADQDYQK